MEYNLVNKSFKTQKFQRFYKVGTIKYLNNYQLNNFGNIFIYFFNSKA